MNVVTPILFVPGWSDRAAHMSWLLHEFARAGWPRDVLQAIDFEDRFGSNIAHAEELSHAVDDMVSRTGIERVDVVAHSMGGLALRYYLHFNGGATRVRRAVFTGTPHRGTWAAYLGWGPGAREMRPGHPLLTRLLELPSVPGEVTALSIQTPLENRVLPQSSARLPDGPNVRVWCASHPRLLRSKRVFGVIRAFLGE